MKTHTPGTRRRAPSRRRGPNSSRGRRSRSDSTATVRFGNPTVGSPFQPPLFDHDASSTAPDTLIPHTSVISARQRDVRHRRFPSGDDLWAGNDARRHRRAAVPPSRTSSSTRTRGFSRRAHTVRWLPRALDAGLRHVRGTWTLPRPVQCHAAHRIREDVRLGERQVGAPDRGRRRDAPDLEHIREARSVAVRHRAHVQERAAELRLGERHHGDLARVRISTASDDARFQIIG